MYNLHTSEVRIYIPIYKNAPTKDGKFEKKTTDLVLFSSFFRHSTVYKTDIKTTSFMIIIYLQNDQRTHY